MFVKFKPSNKRSFKRILHIRIIAVDGNQLCDPSTPCLFQVFCGNYPDAIENRWSASFRITSLSDYVINTDGVSQYKAIKARHENKLTTADLAFIQEEIKRMVDGF